jgi:hypothetical protein
MSARRIAMPFALSRDTMLDVAEQLHRYREQLIEAALTGEDGALEALDAADDLGSTEQLLIAFLRKDMPMLGKQPKPTPPSPPAAVAPPTQVLIAHRGLNFAGKHFPRGSVVPNAVLAAHNGRALLSSGAIVYGIASATMPQPRDLPPPAPPEPPRPSVVIMPGADAVESYTKTLQRLIDAGMSYAVAQDMIIGYRNDSGPAGADLHRRAHALGSERASRLSGASYRRPFVHLTPTA